MAVSQHSSGSNPIQFSHSLTGLFIMHDLPAPYGYLSAYCIHPFNDCRDMFVDENLRPQMMKRGMLDSLLDESDQVRVLFINELYIPLH